MNPDYIFQIGQIYRKTQQDEEETSCFSDGKSHWVGNYKNFKNNIKAHLRREQHGRCVFCRRIIDESQCASTIEHILPKSKYPQFETYPENLVLSCHDCNNKKGERVPLIEDLCSIDLSCYPPESDLFIIIYPYQDKYEEHIDVPEDTCIATPITEKGKNTIQFYKLNRERLVIMRKADLEKREGTYRSLILRLCEAPEEDKENIIKDLQYAIENRNNI